MLSFNIRYNVPLVEKIKKTKSSLREANCEHAGLSSRQIEGNKFFSIEKSVQSKQNWNEVRKTILNELNISPNSPTFQVVGSSGKFMYSPENSKFIQDIINNEILSEKEYLLLYGATGFFRENEYGDVNGCINNLIDKSPQIASNIIANIVDATTDVMEKYEADISEKVKNYFYVFSNDSETKFGDDIDSSDPLTNHTVYCFEGGAQSFSQSMLVLSNGGNVKAYTGLLTDQIKDKNLIVASQLINYLKNAFETASFTQISDADKSLAINSLVSQYFKEYKIAGLSEPDRWDAETKFALLKRAVELISSKKLWEKFDRVTIENVAEIKSKYKLTTI